MKYAAILIFLLISIFFGTELDLPILPPDDPRREEYVPGERPEPPAADPVDVPDPPTVIFGEEIIVPKGGSIVFVIDKSSSMTYDWGDGRDRWAVVKEQIMGAVESLPADTKFNIVVFDSHVPPYYATWSELRESNDENKASSIGWLHRHKPLASTSTAPGVIMGLGFRPDRIVLLTDGQPNVIGAHTYSAQHHRMLIAQNNPGIPIDVFGIKLGSDAIANGVARPFCMGVASDSGGMFYDIR